MAKILFLGDFYYDYDFIAEDIIEIEKYIKQNNLLTILNLEGGLSDKDNNPIKKRGPNLVSSKKTVEVLKKLNVIGVTLANNHILDFGEQGLKETINILNENNIKHCGAGKDLKEALSPMKYEFEKKIYNIYNYGWKHEETIYAKKDRYGCAPRNENTIIKNLKDKDSYNIIIMHWGFEYNLYPQPYDRKLAYKIIKNGANLIVGHHPHNIQPKEIFQGKEIYYSLGNFYFSSRRDRFINKKFNCQYEDRCNYGLGVVFNTETKSVEKRILFYYDKNKKKTNILEDNSVIEKVNENITNKFKKNSQYIRKIKDTKLNINPILTKNIAMNKLKIIYLFWNRNKWKLKNKLSKIKKIIKNS